MDDDDEMDGSSESHEGEESEDAHEPVDDVVEALCLQFLRAGMCGRIYICCRHALEVENGPAASPPPPELALAAIEASPASDRESSGADDPNLKPLALPCRGAPSSPLNA